MPTDAGGDFEPDPRSVEALEWPALLAVLAARCDSDAAAARPAGFAWPPDFAALDRRLRETAEAIAWAAGEGCEADPADRVPDLSGLPDADALLEVARRGGGLEPDALLDVARLARLARDAAGRLLLRAARFPVLAALFSGPGGEDLDLPRLSRLAAAIEGVVAPDGAVRDDASPALAGIRGRIRATGVQIARRMDELSVSLGDHLQDRFVTEREGRPVLPVRVEAQGRVPGIVHGASGSGATVFVEPREVVGEVNALRMLHAAERREVVRLLRDLAADTAAAAGDLALAFRGLVALDHRLATARFARDVDAVLPVVAEAGGHRIEAGRHPLLALSGAPVVPNDLEVLPGDALVISGPNAGGKTVAMKTLGLAVLLAHAGLPVPARSARIGRTRRVFCEIGDDQSLALSLSSFSAHVSNLARIVRAAGPGDLVLVDEPAGGTDPAEGAALAVAVTRRLVRSGAAAVLTTHYEPLKRLADSDPRIRTASMGLEPESLRPTFRLRPGEAGVSTALHVAARYGMPVDVVEEARGVLPEAHRDLQDRLARIDSLRAAAERDAVRAAAERIDLEADRVRLADELARARRREHEAIRGEVDGLWRSIHALREELRGARRLLPAGSRPSPETLRRAADLVESAAARLVPGGDVAAALGGPPPGESVPPEAFGDGDTVHVATVGREGILVGRERDVAVVAFGTLKVRAPWGAIRRIRRAEPAPAGSTGRAVSPPSDAGPPRWTPRSPDNTIDLRGLRVDEAVDRLDERLDRLFQADAATAYVVHGHGTGAVRRAVREHLRNHPLSGESRPGEPSEGGDGVTVVRLR